MNRQSIPGPISEPFTKTVERFGRCFKGLGKGSEGPVGPGSALTGETSKPYEVHELFVHLCGLVKGWLGLMLLNAPVDCYRKTTVSPSFVAVSQGY